MQGPLGAVVGAFSGGGGHTQESALSYLNADMDYLAQATQRVRDCLESAVDGVQVFGGSMLMEMAPATQEMTILADTAGVGQQNLNAMIDALGPLQGKWIEAGEVMATASQAIDRMSDTLSVNNEFLAGCSSQADAFSQMLVNLAGGLELPAGPASALQATIGELVGQWQMGSLSAEDLTFKLKQAFAGALAEAANQADMTTERMRALEESIRSIPTDWITYVSVVYQEENKPSTLHGGGRVMHSGGWLANLPRFHSGAQVTNLAQDEVPIIARRGEYVVRAESVTAASLPWLAALNQSGKPPTAVTANPQVNLHLEVHGNILGNESGLEALARTLERIFQDKGVVIDWDADEDLFFQGERQDFLEIAGNAMENACIWCKGRVRVRTQALAPQRFRLTVEDDGPGLPAERRTEVLQRGARLDESAPGSGLGLSIIDELARAYGGDLRLDDAALGGLRVELELPRADG
jgi:hypothetical protein